jgi:hypothetical protein
MKEFQKSSVKRQNLKINSTGEDLDWQQLGTTAGGKAKKRILENDAGEENVLNTTGHTCHKELWPGISTAAVTAKNSK